MTDTPPQFLSDSESRPLLPVVLLAACGCGGACGCGCQSGGTCQCGGHCHDCD